MNISRRSLWLIVISLIYLVVGYYYLFVQRNDGILVLAQFAYCFICGLPLYCKGIARFLHMRPLFRR